MLDIRFDFDMAEKDRLGKYQLEWLDELFTKNKDSDITIISSGVQILPDRWFFTECFEWPSKKMIFNLIKKHEKSGVILLSGDVHFA